MQVETQLEMGTAVPILIYPNAPGWKSKDTETSRQSAVEEREKSSVIRDQVMRILARWECTADEAATFLGLSVLSVRPRFSELKAQGKVEATANRRCNVSGKKAVVWRAKSI